ncbi:flavocytochrome c [Sutterella parvirubra]|uniref:Urocanate reductase n=1 Tax=Sutterella parvirubra YIT 11816 TaxID=762967 RepID=H3KD06_9BURK|nr:flavocytochrome c [Sutterella parvirubra]EHY32002.1 flavocytochrome c [Sutterella parvirubra YIT 11816]
MKIRFTPIALALMGVSVATAGSAAELTMKPGVYTATVNGHNAPMTVEVTVSEHKIEKIDASKNLETIGVGRKAIEKMTAKILDMQSIGVDAVTGATVTSSAIWSAVKQCLEQAGADMKAVTAKVEKHPSGERTIDADVVIVGGGGAGLAAAVSAHEAGAKKVVVLEKLGYLGGSTNVSEGALNAVDPARQGKQGIEDSTAKFYEQTLKGGHDKGDPELVKYLTENSLSSVEWLEAHGVKFKDEIGTATGALWQRSHYPATPSGNTYIRALEAVIDKTNGAIEVITDAEVNDLIKAEGRIAGVKAKHFGEKLTVSSDAVVITTGGFGANVKLRQEVNTGVWKHVVLDNKIGTTNINKAAQGQGMDLAKKYGAQLIGLDDIQLHPCGTPGTGLMENIRTSGRNRIFVNVDGDRFVNEGAARDVLANAIIKQPKGTYWIVVNKVRYPARDWVDANGATIRDMVALGSVVEADSLDDLAKKTGMDAGKLKVSIDGYNKIVKDGAKDPLGFVANNKADTTLTEGPWYACQKVVTVHHTMGGIKINTKAEVIGTDGKVIPGLYAAGEVTGGIHGSNRLGGNAIADVMLFGRTAGVEAAAFAKSH